MGIFSKTTSKEYNESLENILENKEVDSDAKNLLLSMLYKIENAYSDYYAVKSDVLPKEQFIKKILTIIEEECHKIVVVTPGTERSKPLEKIKQNSLIDVATGSILVYANEKDLLYAIYMLDLKYNQFKVDKEYNIAKANNVEQLRYRAIQNFFSIGTAMHESEVIRDFSGWSWSVNTKDIENIELNLLYQNILLLVGTKTRDTLLIPKAKKHKFSSMQANVQDLRKYNQLKEEKSEQLSVNAYNDIIKEAFSKHFNNSSTKDLIYDLNLSILALEIQKDSEKRKQIEYRLKEEKKILALMEDEKSFLKTLRENQRKLDSCIKRIDRIISSQILLKREYEERNRNLPDEKKIFSANHLIKILEKEKKQYLNEIQTENKLFDPKKYKEKYMQYMKEMKLYDGIVKASKNMDMLLIRIQLEFLKCFMSLIENAKTKNELQKLLYKFRYYYLLQVNENTKIKDIPELKEALETVINVLIDKCIDKKLIENVSNSVSLCYSILNHIFETQTTNLNNLEIRVTKNKEEITDANGENKLYYITVDYFDEKEQVESHSEVVDNLKLLNIRLKKKTPLFL